MSGAENFLRFLGGIGGGSNAFSRTADAMNPDAAYKRQLMEQQKLAREAAIRQFESMQQNNPQALGSLRGLNPLDFLQQGGDLATLGTLQKVLTPKTTKFEDNLRVIQGLSTLPPEIQDQYKTLFGKGGTTVNVGSGEDAFTEGFSKDLGKGRAKEILTLDTEAGDYMSQARSAEQALNLLNENPDINISPFAPLSNTVKSALSDFISEDELKNVADYQQLDSQLIRNRFDVTKVLKGAITEQEQAAAQTVAGKATGTREGLQQTLKNNMAFATLQADYNQRKSQFIQERGRAYSPKEFDNYYKELGESGQRPTLESLLGVAPKAQPIKAGAKVKWSDF